MPLVGKVFLFLMVSAFVRTETAKRDLTNLHPGLDFLHLGNFGPLSRLPLHPTFSHLGLTSQQAIGFINILFQNGFLSPQALRQANGQPFAGDFQSSYVSPGHFYGFPGPVVDPYIFYLLSNYARYLPFGLGPQGIYGSTGLPKPRPVGLFKHSDKN